MLHRSATTHRGIIHADALRIVPHTQVAGETLVINAVLEGFDFEVHRPQLVLLETSICLLLSAGRVVASHSGP